MILNTIPIPATNINDLYSSLCAVYSLGVLPNLIP
nr:MAG TPA: hypothetical protein [Caudoviricetes sp.]